MTLEVGETAHWYHEITQADVDGFVALSGDSNPLHVDPAFSERAGFGDIVVHGALTLAFVSAAVGVALPGPGALILSQRADYVSPVRVGDRLRITLTVVAAHAERNTYDIGCLVETIDSRSVLRGHLVVQAGDAAIEVPDNGDQDFCVIVTGASRGLGAAIASRIAQDGAPVIVNYRTARQAAESVVEEILGSGGRAKAVRADVTSAEDVEWLMGEATSHYGGIRGLVNNAAGAPRHVSAAELNWSDFRVALDEHAQGAIRCSLAAADRMRGNTNASIVNIGSSLAERDFNPNWVPYSVSKSVVHALTRQLAHVYGPHGIRVNCVAPGLLGRGMTRNLSGGQKALARARTLLGSLAQPEAVASAVAYLISSESRFLTGETLAVDSGV